MLLLVTLFALPLAYAKIQPCNLTQSEELDGLVCVCTEDYCDSGTPDLPDDGQVLVVTSNEAGKRFDAQYQDLLEANSENPYNASILLDKKAAVLRIDRSKKYQSILGFGGAFTDVVGALILNMTDKLADQFFNSYFSQDGLRYNMGRTPLGFCDSSFSIYYHTTEENDFNMTSWAVRDEDLTYRFPMIKRAMSMSKDEFLLTGNVWSVPPWLRTYNADGYRQIVIEEHYDSYSLYIMKFLQAARDNGIEFWTVGMTNEPLVSQGLRITPTQGDVLTQWPLYKLGLFAVNHFYPDLQKYGFNNTEILFLDDSLDIIDQTSVMTFFSVPGIWDIVKYVGLHAYKNIFMKLDYVVTNFVATYPNITLFDSEHCQIDFFQSYPMAGWGNAEFYANLHLEEMNSNYTAWIDWVLLLDTNRGPTLNSTSTLSNNAINFDVENNIFYKTPIYYSIGQFSKFIPRGSVRLDMQSQYTTDLVFSAVQRPDGLITAVLLNKHNSTVDVTIQDEKGNIKLEISPKSITTLVF